MCKKWSFLIVAGTFLLTNCSQTIDTTDTPTGVPTSPSIKQPAMTATLVDTPTPTPVSTQTPELEPSNAQTLTSADPVQINLFRLVPPEFLGAGYSNNKQIMEDSELRAACDDSPDVCPFLGSQILEGVDASIAFNVKSTNSSKTIFGIVYILYGDFTEVTMPELLQELQLGDPVPQDYQGFELMAEEQGDPFNFAVVIMDESTIVFGEETGVKAVLDTASGLKSPPLADLGAALPSVLYAAMLKSCPKYASLGCTAAVILGLAKETMADLSLLQLYQFEDLDLAANALDTILAEEDIGNTIQFGSITIASDTITQDGRFILKEGFLPIEEIGALFE
jgi:hypothetical protein